VLLDILDFVFVRTVLSRWNENIRLALTQLERSEYLCSLTKCAAAAAAAADDGHEFCLCCSIEMANVEVFLDRC
jgi:hypothetical protein